MNTSRNANIDKFVNIRYIFLIARRAYTASTNDGLPEISKMKYWIPELGRTTISGFADGKKKKN
jgi:hypothetical protein